jgi:hypothetical protein
VHASDFLLHQIDPDLPKQQQQLYKMKIISFASIILPGASAAFPEALYAFDTTGKRCSGDSYEATGITSAEECKAALADEGTDTTNFQVLNNGGWFNGCFKNNWGGPFYNTGFNGDSAVAQGHVTGSGALFLCKEKLAEPVHRFDTDGGQCADPNYDVDGFTSAEECKQALGDEGTDTSTFQGQVSLGDWFNGCFKNNWNGGASWYNVGFEDVNSAVAQTNVDNTKAQYLCKKKPPTAAPTASPTEPVFESDPPATCDTFDCTPATNTDAVCIGDASTCEYSTCCVAPTAPPTAPATEPVFESEKCDPKECDQWTCKNWCKCFKAHPEIIEIFEGSNPSAGEQAIRNSCPSDNDECDCTKYHFGNAKVVSSTGI